MADTYTSLLRLIQQEPLTKINQWGTVFNAGVTDLIEAAIAGVATVNMTSGTVTLTTGNGVPDTSRPMFLDLTGSPAGVATLTVPATQKLYVIANRTNPGRSVLVKTPAGSPVVIVPEAVAALYVDGNAGEVRALGFAEAISADQIWNPIVCNVASGGFAVTAYYTKMGDLVTLRVPAFTATFVGTNMTLEVDGGMPDEMKPAVIASGVFPSFPVPIIDGTLKEAYCSISQSAIAFTSGHPTNLFTNNGERSLPMDFTCSYFTTDD